MKKKVFLSLVIVIAIMLTAVGCGAHYDAGGNFGGGMPENETENIAGDGENTNVKNRKVIYTASFTMTFDDIADGVKTLKSKMASDEWVETEQVSDTYATLVLRIRSENLDTYIAAISTDVKLYDFNKTAQDISLNYYDKQAQIETLTAEKTRLTELIADENTTFSDIIILRKRITEIDYELTKLNRDINIYDSKVDYSTVTATLRQTYTPPAQVSFGQKAKNVFVGAWKALLSFFKGVFFAITAVLPFALVLGGTATIVIITVKKIKKRKSKLKTLKNIDDTRADTNNNENSEK